MWRLLKVSLVGVKPTSSVLLWGGAENWSTVVNTQTGAAPPHLTHLP